MAELAGMIERIARGEAQAFIPYGERQDEIGALARSMALFRDAMRRNSELDQAVSGETEARARRQTQMINEVASFSSEIEATLAELGRIPDHMLDASGKLASVAQDASAKMSRAEAASAEASQNVRDIASAADELSASVNEIDRQVTQARQRRKPRAALKLRRDARRKRRVKSGWSVRRRRTRARARGP